MTKARIIILTGMTLVCAILGAVPGALALALLLAGMVSRDVHVLVLSAVNASFYGAAAAALPWLALRCRRTER